MSTAGGSHSRIEFVLYMAPLVDKFDDLAQSLCVDFAKIAGVDIVGPTLEVGCSFLPC